MVVEGIVYVGGVRAEDGTLVEATIDGETVASFETVTSDGQQGLFIMRIDDEQGSEIAFLVDGEAAEVLVEGEAQSTLPYEPGFQVADLIIAGSPPTRTLTMAVEGNGRTVPSVGEHTYPEGAQVRIGAVPDAGWRFDGWSADVADPRSPSTQVVVDEDKTITARFVPLPVSTPSPEPTSTPGPSPTVTSTGIPTATPTGTMEPSGTPTSTAPPDATPTSSATPTADGTSPPDGTPSATPVSGSPTVTEGTEDEASPTPSTGATESPSVSEGSTATSESTSVAEEASPAPGETGSETPAEAVSPSNGEDDGQSRGVSTLVIVAGALALAGLIAVAIGFLGLTRGDEG
jgi:hypothetical protein